MNLLIIATLALPALATSLAPVKSFVVEATVKENMLKAMENIFFCFKFTSALMDKAPRESLLRFHSNQAKGLIANDLEARERILKALDEEISRMSEEEVERDLAQFKAFDEELLKANERIYELIKSDHYNPESFYHVLNQSEHHPIQYRALKAIERVVNDLKVWKAMIYGPLERMKSELNTPIKFKLFKLCKLSTQLAQILAAIEANDPETIVKVFSDCLIQLEKLKESIKSTDFEIEDLNALIKVADLFGLPRGLFPTNPVCRQFCKRYQAFVTLKPESCERFQRIVERLIFNLEYFLEIIKRRSDAQFCYDAEMKYFDTFLVLSIDPVEVVEAATLNSQPRFDVLAPFFKKKAVREYVAFIDSFKKLFSLIRANNFLGRPNKIQMLYFINICRFWNKMNPSDPIETDMFIVEN